jgi:CRP-like cAMP-binding protein
MEFAEETTGLQAKVHASAPGAEHGGEGAPHGPERNRLLRALASEDYASLLPRLSPVHLRPKQVLSEPGVPLAHAWFPRHGAVALVAVDHDGGEVEVSSVGFEGFVGLPLLLEDDTPPNRVMVAVEGDAWRIAAADFRCALQDLPAIRITCARYAAFFTAQLSQAVACNRIHSLEERCARWLLATHDRVDRQPFAVTHEFLAALLGVRRASVTVTMGALQGAGVIHYHRGRASVLDRPKLEAASCSCHDVTQSELGRLFGSPPLPPVGSN